MRRWLWMAAVLILVAAGDAALWRFATHRLEASFSDWAATRRAAGWRVSVADRQAGGWPFAATLRLDHASLEASAPALRRAAGWQADRVVLRVSLLHPGTLQIDASGPGHLGLDASRGISYTSRRLVAAVPLWTATPPGPVAVSADDLRVERPDLAVSLQHLSALGSFLPAAKAGEAAAAVSFSAAGIVLPAGPDWALGRRIAALAGDAVLNGPLPAEGELDERAIIWRDDGGMLDVRSLQAEWGPLHLRAKARLQLDPQLQPAGDGSATVSGYAATADALAAHGVMTQGAAVAAKALLSLMAHPTGGGGPSEVEFPLSLQHRTLAMRQVPLVRLPALDWPGQ